MAIIEQWFFYFTSFIGSITILKHIFDDGNIITKLQNITTIFSQIINTIMVNTLMFFKTWLPIYNILVIIGGIFLAITYIIANRNKSTRNTVVVLCCFFFVLGLIIVVVNKIFGVLFSSFPYT